MLTRSARVMVASAPGARVEVDTDQPPGKRESAALERVRRFLSGLAVAAAAVLATCSIAACAHTATTSTQTMSTPQGAPAPHAMPVGHAQRIPEADAVGQAARAAAAAPADGGLGALEAMTFSCPKAGLNAAARQAAQVPSQGTYQFSYFRLVGDSHHSSYEVHFKSNYEGEPELRYCVAIYCQQGWDPRTTQTFVTLMNAQGQGRGATGSECGMVPVPPK